MGAQISKNHSPEELVALRQAEAAVWKHYGLTERLQELKLPLVAAAAASETSDQPELPLPPWVRLWQLGSNKADAQHTVLFIHGGGGTPADWAALLPSLAEHTNKNNQYRFLLLERPGSGLSDPYDFSNLEQQQVDVFHAQYVASVLKALQIAQPIHIVGNSMGGCISVWFAQAFPEKIRSLTIMGVPAGFVGMQLPFMFHVLGSWVGKQIMSRPPPRSLAVDLFATHFHANMEKVPDVVIDYLWVTQKTRNNSLSWQSLLAKVVHRECAWTLESLQDLPFPCQFVVGSQDTDFMPVKQQEQVGRYLAGGSEEEEDNGSNNGRLGVGQGHLPWIEDPDGAAKALFKLWENRKTEQ